MPTTAARFANTSIGNDTDAFWQCLEYTVLALSAKLENDQHVLVKPFIFVLNSLLAFAAFQMVHQTRSNNALGVFICIMSDAFNMPSLFRNNVFQNNWALEAFATWYAVLRLLNRHSKEAIDLQVARLSNSAWYAPASMLCRGAMLRKNKRGVTEIGIVPLRCRSCGLLRTPKQNMVRVEGCVPAFYVGVLCCLLPKKHEILQSTSIMKLLEVLFYRVH